MSSALPEWLVDYMRRRDQQWADEVNAVLASLTERERHLVHDAAVTGYAHGRRHPAGAAHPKDTVVVTGVINACPGMSHLPDRERRLVRDAAVMAFVHGRQASADPAVLNDATIVGNVIAACLVHADLYPVLSGVRLCGVCDHPGYNHTDADGEDPDAPGTCLQCVSLKVPGARHDYRLKH